MDKVRIERFVPVADIRGKGRKASYPFSTMEIGDSFWLKGEAGERASAAARKFSQRNPEIVLVSRSEGEGRRIWRVKAYKPR